MHIWKVTSDNGMQHHPIMHARLWHVRIWKITSTDDTQHQLSPSCIRHVMWTWTIPFEPWFECINQATSPMACAHRPMEGNNNKYVHTSVMVCAYRLMYIKPGLRTLSMRHHPMAGRINQGLHASSVACVHRLGDIGHVMHALAR